MHIDKAIEILEKEHEDTFMGSEKDWKDAVKLGIQALKRVQLQHDPAGCITDRLLPSETED